MKALRDKKGVPWLFVLIVVLSAIAIYRIGFHIPVPAFNEQVVTSLKQGQSQQEQVKPDGAEIAVSADPPGPVVPPPPVTDSRRAVLAGHPYRSEHPLYFRAAFGDKSSNTMLGLVDESGGTGTGYNVAYVDENMNGDLTDEAARTFPRREQGSRVDELEPRFEFGGPFRGAEKAKYTLYIYSLAYKNRVTAQGYNYSLPFHWFMDVNQWNYFFINGRMTLLPSAIDAIGGTPVCLGGPCKWQINSQTRDGKPMISAALKDENGCTLRNVRCAGQTISPTLTLMQDGQVKAKEQMKFG